MEYEAVTYEGYGPGGSAVLVYCRTSDRDRTVAGLRSAFAQSGGILGARGSIAYLFNEVGVLSFPEVDAADGLAETAIDCGAEDVVTRADGACDVLTDPRDLAAVRAALERAGHVPASAGVTLRPAVVAMLAGEEATRMRALLEALAAVEGVERVYSNADLRGAR